MVTFGPIADVAREKLSREEPELFELASMCGCIIILMGTVSQCQLVSHNNPLKTCFPESEPRDAGTDQRSSGIIRLHTIKQIIDRVNISPFYDQQQPFLHYFNSSFFPQSRTNMPYWTLLQTLWTG